MLKFLAAALLVVATALTISFTASVTQAGYNGADPATKGDKCFKKTDGRGHGYWAICPHK
jgi:hypothetical protein